MKRILLVSAVLLTLVTPGCLGLFGSDDDAGDDGPETASAELGAQNVARIEEVASGQFKNWTFPNQEVLDPVTQFLNGTVSPGGVPGHEDRNDRSGTDYNSKLIVNDISNLAPPQQPVELRIKMWYFGQAGSSADLDLYVNVPGTHTTYAADSSDEFSWKVSSQEMVVSTVRLPGEPFEIGVQVSNERIATEGLEYFLQVDATYAQNVITPGVPYAVEVPEDARGLILGSAKAGGDEHIRGHVLVIGPDDTLVDYVEYNDIALAEEQRRIRIDQPGEYVLYALNLTGGFLSPSLDVAVPQELREVRILDKVEESAVDFNQAAPGMVEQDFTFNDPVLGSPVPAQTEYSEGGSATFSVEGRFPLEITGFIEGDTIGAAEVRISSSNGEVFRLSKVAQHQDDDGQIGLTRDELNTDLTYENLATGTYTISFVNNGQAEIGHTIVTYRR